MNQSSIKHACIAVLFGLVVACSGEVAQTPASPTKTVVSGVAAKGAALANATITVTDANQVSVSTTTDSTGYYELKYADVATLTPPLIFTATVTVGGNTTTYRSALTADFSNVYDQTPVTTLNINPLTDITLALLSSTSDPATVTPVDITQGSLDTALTQVLNTIGTPTLNLVNLNGTFNPFNSNMTVAGSAGDVLLDLLNIQITAGATGNTIYISSNAVAGTAQPAIVLTPTSTATLSTPTLTVAQAQLYFNVLSTLQEHLNACFAIPAPNRASFAGSTLTTIAPACDNIFSTYTPTVYSGNLAYLNAYTNNWQDRLTNSDFDNIVVQKTEYLNTTGDYSTMGITFTYPNGQKGVWIVVMHAINNQTQNIADWRIDTQTPVLGPLMMLDCASCMYFGSLNSI